MKTKNMMKFIYLLATSNLFFVGSYAFLAIHALFLHDPATTETLKPYIILGMSIFGATQVGGVWLLSLINDRLSTSILFLTVTRLLGIGLLVIPAGWAIVSSLLAFGLSHAAYYKTSRLSLSNILKVSGITSSKSYFLFSLTTNLAYLVLPLMGSKVLSVEYNLMIGSVVTVCLALLGIFILSKSLKIGSSAVNVASANEVVVESKVNKKELTLDILRFAGFVLPYTIMMAIIPIKTAAAGLPAVYNSIFLGFNSAIIIAYQLLGLKFKLTEYSTKKYDVYTIIASVITLTCLWLNIWLIVPLFIVWSICESYQMPNLEYHLFSKRTYSSKVINNILALDAIFCFLGPIVAAANLYVIRFSNLELNSEAILNKIVSFFM